LREHDFIVEHRAYPTRGPSIRRIQSINSGGGLMFKCPPLALFIFCKRRVISNFRLTRSNDFVCNAPSAAIECIKSLN
jgi:hypothetical protein